MIIRHRIHKRFRQLGLRYLRVEEQQAELLAFAVSDAHDKLGAFCTFCQLPEGRPASVNVAILTRWLDTVPTMLELPSMLARKPIELEPIVSFSEDTLERIYESAMRLAMDDLMFGLPEATEYANCIRSCSSPTFAFYQRCNAPEDYRLDVLAAFLTGYIQRVLPSAAGALQLMHQNRVAG